MSGDAAARLAATLVAASEGAVVVSRAEGSLEPFELVAAELLAMAPGARPQSLVRRPRVSRRPAG
jgi:hypothetical protein